MCFHPVGRGELLLLRRKFLPGRVSGKHPGVCNDETEMKGTGAPAAGYGRPYFRCFRFKLLTNSQRSTHRFLKSVFDRFFCPGHWRETLNGLFTAETPGTQRIIFSIGGIPPAAGRQWKTTPRFANPYPPKAAGSFIKSVSPDFMKNRILCVLYACGEKGFHKAK